jgi:dihydropteroate synthase
MIHISSKDDALKELEKIGAEPQGIKAMLPKMQSFIIHVEGLECKVANIMKQEMLSIGGDVAVARGVVDCSIERSDAIIMGTVKQIEKLSRKIEVQPFGMRSIAKELQDLMGKTSRVSFILKTPEREVEIGGRTLIMGILNMTPDSFSDGGQFSSVEEALTCAVKMEEEGADIIDIGGESTRPGSDSVSDDEELKRVIPLIKKLKNRIKIPISIDTTKSIVAKNAIDEGAEIINDVSALRADQKMTELIASTGMPVVLMHMRGIPKTMQQIDVQYKSVCGDIISFLRERIETAGHMGIGEEKIIIDPGIGFGKTMGDNLNIIKHLKEFRVLGRPILIGPSRKSFIGRVTGSETGKRIEGTAAVIAASIMNGAHIVRVHDVSFMKRVADMSDAIARS